MKKANVFIIFVLGLSWLFALLFYLSGMKLLSFKGVLFAIVYMYIPTFITLVLRKVYNGNMEDYAINFKINKYFVYASVIPIILALLVLFVDTVLPFVKVDYSLGSFIMKYASRMNTDKIHKLKHLASHYGMWSLVVLVSEGFIAGVSINALIAFGEELGWRGFLYKELKHLSFLKVSFIIGIVWGVWHFPLILMGLNYPHHRIIGIFMMIMFTLLLSPIFTYIREKSDSVVATSVLHGVLNATAGIPIIYVVNGNELITTTTGLVGFAVLFVFDLFILLLKKKEVGR